MHASKGTPEGEGEEEDFTRRHKMSDKIKKPVQKSTTAGKESDQERDVRESPDASPAEPMGDKDKEHGSTGIHSLKKKDKKTGDGHKVRKIRDDDDVTEEARLKSVNQKSGRASGVGGEGTRERSGVRKSGIGGSATRKSRHGGGDGGTDDGAGSSKVRKSKVGGTGSSKVRRSEGLDGSTLDDARKAASAKSIQVDPELYSSSEGFQINMNGTWRDLPRGDNAHLTKAMKNHLEGREIGNYYYDLHRMVQIKKESGNERKVRAPRVAHE